MRGVLRTLYLATGALAGVAMVLIVLVVLYQVAARLLGVGVRGADDVVAWLTATASLAGVGYAATQNSHVKVELLVARLGGPARFATVLASLVVGTLVSVYAAYACVLMVVESYQLGELSQGDIPVPLWLPQLGVAVGTVTLTIALLDVLVRLLRSGQVDLGLPAKSALEEI